MWPIGAAWSSTKPNSASSGRRVERAGTPQPDLLAGREDELAAAGRTRGRPPPRGLQDHRHPGLVVGAEDRGAAVAIHAVDQLHLHPVGERHRVDVRAEHHGARAGRAGDARQQVSAPRTRLRSRVVLDHGEAHRLELRPHGRAHGALVTARALDLAQARERIADPPVAGVLRGPCKRHQLPRWAGSCAARPAASPSAAGSARRRAHRRRSVSAAPAVPRSRARASAAPTNSRNSGWGLLGRDLNSGWYCEATK